MTAKMSNSELTRTLRALALAQSRAFRLREKISEHSTAVYGVDPADIDCDEFIDSCDGGGGECGGMSAMQFDEAMRAACARAGVPPK